MQWSNLANISRGTGFQWFSLGEGGCGIHDGEGQDDFKHEHSAHSQAAKRKLVDVISETNGDGSVRAAGQDEARTGKKSVKAFGRVYGCAQALPRQVVKKRERARARQDEKALLDPREQRGWPGHATCTGDARHCVASKDT